MSFYTDIQFRRHSLLRPLFTLFPCCSCSCICSNKRLLFKKERKKFSVDFNHRWHMKNVLWCAHFGTLPKTVTILRGSACSLPKFDMQIHKAFYFFFKVANWTNFRIKKLAQQFYIRYFFKYFMCKWQTLECNLQNIWNRPRCGGVCLLPRRHGRLMPEVHVSPGVWDQQGNRVRFNFRN